MDMLQMFTVGDQITGFCNGFFGRDDYEEKTCVMVTSKYAVFQYQDGRATVLNYSESLESVNKTDWMV